MGSLEKGYRRESSALADVVLHKAWGLDAATSEQEDLWGCAAPSCLL
jgi:hypothetical protein